MRLHLIEPYRSAIIAKSQKEGFIETIPAGLEGLSPGMVSCGTDILIAEALQLVVLASEPSMVWTEIGEVAREKGMPHMKLAGLENLGAIELVSNYPSEMIAIEKRRWEGLRNLDELWAIEEEEIESLWPLISTQLESRGKALHWSLYRLLRAVRLGNDKAVPLILSTVPDSLRQAADSILTIEPRMFHEIELPIIMELQHLRLTDLWSQDKDVKIAGAAPVGNEVGVSIGRHSRQLWGLVVEELIGEEIVFPVPKSLRDVVVLRDRAEVVDFRKFIMPFLDAAVAGDETTVVHLRKSIRACISAFRRYPTAQKLARWTAYIGLGADVIEGMTRVPGVGIGLGVIGLGLEALANRWKHQSSWIYLARL